MSCIVRYALEFASWHTRSDQLPNHQIANEPRDSVTFWNLRSRYRWSIDVSVLKINRNFISDPTHRQIETFTIRDVARKLLKNKVRVIKRSTDNLISPAFQRSRDSLLAAWGLCLALRHPWNNTLDSTHKIPNRWTMYLVEVRSVSWSEN